MEELGRKERKKQNKARITTILTNEKVVVLQTKVNSGLPRAGETKRNSQGVIILKAGMVFISGGGVAVVVFPGEPWFLYYLGTSVLSCTNELEAPFFSPLVFYISQWEALWKLLKMCEQSFAVRKYNPMTLKRGGNKKVNICLV